MSTIEQLILERAYMPIKKFRANWETLNWSKIILIKTDLLGICI